MIKAITVTNYLGESLKMELARPEKSGFIVRSVSGLGPGKATVNSSEISTTDGSIFNSARVPSRNIVISLIFMWKDTIEDARHLSYKYFPLKKKVTLVIETDKRSAEIEGYVESNEPNIFSQEEGADISIVCPNPFFYAAYQTHITSFGAIEPLFEFPFSNESLTECLIELSAIRNEIDRTVLYDGDQQIGITISIRAKGKANGIAIYNVGTKEVMRINTTTIESITGGGIDEGDEIIICTEIGKKSAVLIRDGKTTNILNCIDRGSSWFQLSKGENIFACTAEFGRTDLEFEIQNRIIYEGV